MGIELETVKAESHLAEDKLQHLRELLIAALVKKKVSLKELHVLLCHLNFACKVVVAGRAFCCRLYMTMGRVIRRFCHYIRLSKKDLRMWVTFLKPYNGVFFWRHTMVLCREFQLHFDVAGGLDFGLCWDGQWCTAPWTLH